MLIHRKDFLKLGSLASASVFVPKFLKAFESGQLVPPGNKVVVILQLSGGNDGLNTVIPVTNDIYYRSRPRLGIIKNKALLLNDEVGLHPSLT
ncbi:MAG: twin-arginine translocation pathway signal, partial [Flavisolibacter sp.]|nr:twin-arginine translocation pathway signal [Flavisolibacter sp.]